MSRKYIVQGKNLTVANGATTLVAINPGAGRVIKVMRSWCSQNANNLSVQCAIELGLKAAAFSTLTSQAPQKLETSDPASLIVGGTAGAAGTSGINATVEGAGATVPLYSDAFNALQGWLWLPSAALDEEIIVSGADAQAIYLKFTQAPATLTNWNFGIEFKELG